MRVLLLVVLLFFFLFGNVKSTPSPRTNLEFSLPPSMQGSGLKVCGGGWVGGGSVQTHFSDQPLGPKSRLINSKLQLRQASSSIQS